jgi:hypothetical protein
MNILPDGVTCHHSCYITPLPLSLGTNTAESKTAGLDPAQLSF